MRVTKNYFPGCCGAEGVLAVMTTTSTPDAVKQSREGGVEVAGGFYAGGAAPNDTFYGDPAKMPTGNFRVSIGTLRTDMQAPQIAELKTMGWVEIASWDGMYQTSGNKYRIIMMAKGSSLELPAAPTIRKRAVRAIRSLRKGGK